VTCIVTSILPSSPSPLSIRTSSSKKKRAKRNKRALALSLSSLLSSSFVILYVYFTILPLETLSQYSLSIVQRLRRQSQYANTRLGLSFVLSFFFITITTSLRQPDLERQPGSSPKLLHDRKVLDLIVSGTSIRP